MEVRTFVSSANQVWYIQYLRSYSKYDVLSKRYTSYSKEQFHDLCTKRSDFSLLLIIFYYKMNFETICPKVFRFFFSSRDIDEKLDIFFQNGSCIWNSNCFQFALWLFSWFFIANWIRCLNVKNMILLFPNTKLSIALK